MRARLAALAAAVALAASAVPAVGQVQQTGASSTEALAKARGLLELVNPIETLVAANVKGWDLAVRRSLSLDPAAVNLERAYPGISEAAIDAARPLARKYLREFVLRSLDYKTGVMAQRLTAEELDEAVRFFASDAGRRSVDALLRNVDMAGMVAELADSRGGADKFRATPEDAVRIERAASAKMMAQVSAADQIAITRFGLSAVGRKFSEAAREADRRIIEMANNPDPEWLAKQAEVMRSAVVAFAERRK